MDGNQLAQSLCSPQPHCTAGILQGLEKGGLQLGQEGLQGDTHLQRADQMKRLGERGAAKTEQMRRQTFASSSVRVSSRAVFTVQAKRSPRMRMRGPVMLTTDGRSASGEVSLMTAPRALAASSFCSGLPLRTPSLNTGRIQVTPCGGRIKMLLPLVYHWYKSAAVGPLSEERYLLGQTEAGQVLTLDLCGCRSNIPVKVINQS